MMWMTSRVAGHLEQKGASASRMRLLLVLIVLAALCFAPNTALCSSIRNCVGLCLPPSYPNWNIAFLNHSDGATSLFRANFEKAITILKNFSHGIIFDDALDPHISLQYLCCYTYSQYELMDTVLAKLNWTTLTVNYANPVCVQHTNKSHISIVVQLDPPSQAKLGTFVASLEEAMINAGLPVPEPRSKMEFFHTTVADAESDYPIAAALAEVTKQIPQFSPQPLTIWDFYALAPPLHRWVASNAQGRE